MNNPFAPLHLGSTIGIIGGGQLGRMLSLAASQLGFKTHIYAPKGDNPAFDVTSTTTEASYIDLEALQAFALSVDMITYEFENIPLETVRFLSQFKHVRPSELALAVSQDRIAEKSFLSKHHIVVAPFRGVTTLETLHAAIADIGLPAVLKTTRLGYDGKGQRIIRTPDDVAPAFADLAGVDLVLESFIPFTKEISVIVTRDAFGNTVSYDAAENVHVHHILKTSTVPANISSYTAHAAQTFARDIANALNYVGTMGVEFFVLENGTLIVNEIAPRVHNSGHWTQAVCITDQFENHIRAIANWPLGKTTRLAPVVMENLIGEEINSIPEHLQYTDQPHVYGKAAVRTGRKMGHINHVGLEKPQ